MNFHENRYVWWCHAIIGTALSSKWSWLVVDWCVPQAAVPKTCWSDLQSRHDTKRSPQLPCWPLGTMMWQPHLMTCRAACWGAQHSGFKVRGAFWDDWRGTRKHCNVNMYLFHLTNLPIAGATLIAGSSLLIYMSKFESILDDGLVTRWIDMTKMLQSAYKMKFRKKLMTLTLTLFLTDKRFFKLKK